MLAGLSASIVRTDSSVYGHTGVGGASIVSTGVSDYVMKVWSVSMTVRERRTIFTNDLESLNNLLIATISVILEIKLTNAILLQISDNN